MLGEGKEGSGKPRPNPVALETMVNVTGAKASGDSSAGDLFSEDTTTVLVFKDGAVIRLSAGVRVGQLVFLTNKKSNDEVVCQVLRKKSQKSTWCFVELQFTEERENFWGVAFPEVGKAAPEFRVTEQLQAEATTAEVAEEPMAPHSAGDVERLKKEVEALRAQLAALEKETVTAAAAKAMAEAAAAREAALREAAKAVEAVTASAPGGAKASGAVTRMKEELAPVNDPSPVPAKVADEKPELLMPPGPKETKEAGRAVVGMALPGGKREKSPEEQLLEEEARRETTQVAADELLPKPALDFSQAPKSAPAGKMGRGAKGRRGLNPDEMRRLTLGVLVLLLVGLGAASWYGKWWVYLPIGKKATVGAPKSAAKAPVAGSLAKPAGTVNVGGAGASAGEKAAKGSSEVPGKEPVQEEKSGSESVAPEIVGKKLAGTAASATVKKAPVTRGKAAEKKSATRSTEQPSAAESVAIASDAPVLPAKLVKPVNPVYPPDAMRNYITGDVKAEVVVKASGRVGEVRVISGPKALREAAVEALKLYEYAPATQGGKAVEWKAVEVVKFWFNP